MSLGIKSGVNWMRVKSSDNDVVLPDDLPGHLLTDLIVGLAQLIQFGQVDQIGRSRRQDRVSCSSAEKPAET
jgi:hypothetical protein